MRRRAVFVAIVALLAGCIPAVRSLDPWERASGDASEIVESSLSSSSSSSSLRDGNDEDGGPGTRTTDASVLAPPTPRLYPPGTGAYAPPVEGSVRSDRREGYEHTIAAQIEKAIDAEFSDEDVDDGARTGGGSAAGDGLGDGSALVGGEGRTGAGGSKFESERREEGAVLERVVVVSGKGKGEAEVVVAKKGNVAKVGGGGGGSGGGGGGSGGGGAGRRGRGRPSVVVEREGEGRGRREGGRGGGSRLRGEASKAKGERGAAAAPGRAVRVLPCGRRFVSRHHHRRDDDRRDHHRGW